MPIPKIINFIWLSKDESFQGYPDKYKSFVQSFRNHNTDFEIKIWNNKDIRTLFSHPDLKGYEQKWDNLPYLIQKCDLSRSLLMHAQGGIYSDFDFVCHRDLSPWIEGRDLAIVKEGAEHGVRMYNGFFASVPGHPIWREWLDHCFDLVDKHPRNISENLGDYIMRTTGPDEFWRFNIARGTEYEDCCRVIPICNNIKTGVGVCDECLSDDVKKDDKEYYKILGNYTDTKWVEGTGYSADRSFQDVVSCCMKYPWVCLAVVIFIIFIIIVIYCIVTKKGYGSEWEVR